MTSTIECQQCGALNGPEFGHCMRCGESLSDAVSADGARRRVPARRGRGTPVQGAEPLFGLWPAETLPIAKALLGITMLVFGVQFTSAWRSDPSIQTLLGGGSVLAALRSGAMLSVVELVKLEPWRLLSACFVHFGVIHLGMNMMALLHLCRLLEPAVGSVRLLIIYVVTGVFGFAVSLVFYTLTERPSPTAGASGALFGLMGAILGFLWRRRDERWKSWLGQTVAFSLLFGFALGGVNNAAHIAGLLAGVVGGLMVAPGAPQPSNGWHRLVAALCALGILASLVLARISDLPELLAAGS